MEKGFFWLLLLSVSAGGTEYNEVAGKEYLRQLNDKMSKLSTESTLASWAYESNITDDNLKNQLAVSAKVAKFEKEAWTETIKYPWQSFSDPDVRRQFKKFSYLGAAALSPEKFERLEKIVKDMQGVYGKAKICAYNSTTNCELQLEPEITELFAMSRNPEELKYLWTEWRKASGRPVRQMFSEYVALTNEAAKLNNFTDAAESWIKDYESDDFRDQVGALWEQLKPLYVQLHTYVRRRLRELYGEGVVSKTGLIPAHLLGNVWAQKWSNILNETIPYPNKPHTDVTPEMVAQNYTPLKMFRVAEEFFTSLGLSPMPESFWKNSIIEKPDDGRDLICHASAWDFYDGKDFRIKQCTRVNTEELETVHHEMGHIQYFLQYKNQPFAYKEGANPGFHEAVGDVMALSVSTPKHLQKIGLLKDYVSDEEAEINQLFAMALDKVAFLPFAYLMDRWRWAVFQGKISPAEYNSKWWELREKYQGMEPPVQRSEEDFDPGAKYHIIASVPYIRYFVSFVVQFQFHRSLCIAAGEYDPENPNLKPLHKCDIYQNKKAGELLGNMLKMGSSKQWPDAMEAVTGQRKMDAGALLEYFSTLQTWLERENAMTGEYVGWEPSSNFPDEDDNFFLIEEPEGLFEHDNLEYSYSEFVPQSDISFACHIHREKLDSSHLFRRSTKTQFEMNKYFDRKFRKKPLAPSDKVAAKFQRGRTLLNRNSKLDLRIGVSRRARKLEVANFDERDGSNVKNKVGLFKEQEREQARGKEPSSLSKLLSSLRSSMPKPGKAMLSTVEAKVGNKADYNNNSILLSNSEAIRLQAEKMLKSMGALNSAEKIPNSKEDKDFRKIVKKAAPQPQILFSSKEDYRPPEAKSVSRKSYVYYHYNLRAPVHYNTAIIKKPKTSSFSDETLPTKKGVSHGRNHLYAKNFDFLVRGNENWKAIKLVPLERSRAQKMNGISAYLSRKLMAKEEISAIRQRSDRKKYVINPSENVGNIQNIKIFFNYIPSSCPKEVEPYRWQ